MDRKFFSKRLDSILVVAFFAGLCAMAYLLGAASMYYRVAPSGTLTEALQAAETWNHTLKKAKKREKRQNKQKSQNSKIEGVRPLPEHNTSWNEEKAYNGYTLITLRFAESAYLVDMHGTVVHQWDMPFTKAWPDPKHIHSLARATTFISKAHVYPNGDLLAQYMGSGDTPYGYGIAKIDKHGTVLWTYGNNSHHDFTIDAAGLIHAIVHKVVKNPVPGADMLPVPSLVDSLVTLSPDGKELESVSLLDAFVHSEYASLLYPINKTRKRAWDYFHTNSIHMLEPDIADTFPMFKPGQLLISMRSLNALAVIDPKAKKVVWAQQGPWHWPHAARFLDNGRIMVLDNLWRTPRGERSSRVVEFSPADKKIVWQFPGNRAEPFRTSIFGRLQRLENGNTLIAETMGARALEVTANGNIVWSLAFDSPRHNAIITATRYTEKELPFLKESVKKPNESR